jgi:four helix bundle protein
MGEQGYKKLIVWQKADDLAYKIYIATKSFPKDELYGITSQLRRAALSVPTNLVEGTGRQGKSELRQFANIALGSLAEVTYLLDFSLKLGYLKEKDYEVLQDLREEVGRLLWKFYKSL